MMLLRMTFRKLGAMRKVVVTVLLLLSVAFNVALFASTTLYYAVSTAVSSVTGTKSLVARQANDISRLQVDLDNERQSKRQLQSELTDSRVARHQLQEELADSRALKRQIRGELADSRAIQHEMREATTEVTQRIAQRNTRAAARSVATMPAESMPIVGTTIIVASASLEVYELCETMNDMTELRDALTPQAEVVLSEDQKTICSIKVPTREEVWASARNAPQATWTSAQKAMPSVEDIQSIELPQIDWGGIGDSISDTARNWSGKASNAAGDLAGKSSDTFYEAWDWIGSLWYK